MLDIMHKFFCTAFDILNGASAWLIMSFILAGLMHNLIGPDKLHRALGNKKLSSLVKATMSGMLLPICSCGVIPLGLGLYYSGAYLGPTLAFMTATPIINPAAVLLSYAFLGPQLATIYLITGFVVPVLIGLAGNALAGQELHAPGIDGDLKPAGLEPGIKLSLSQKLSSGLYWGFFDMGTSVSKYVCIGMLLAGLIITLVPAPLIQQYLGSPSAISLAGIAALGTIMYVCAVGHIPFIAALIASGAAPGLAITFLLTGTATNLPFLISMYKMIGWRTLAVYSGGLVLSSLAIGCLTNFYLLPGFVPVFDLAGKSQTVALANSMIFSAPNPLRYLCSAIIIALGLYSLWPGIKKALLKERIA